MTINNNGKLKTYDRTERNYSTNVYTRLADHAIRDASKLHLAAVLRSGSMYSASYGHACMHDLQPMQR